MKILLLGSGGREHALAWKIAQSPKVEKLFIAPGNAGTGEVGENVNIKATDFAALGAFALEESIDMIVVGPEDPLVEGIYDHFQSNPCLKNIAIIGPSKEGARLEGVRERIHAPPPHTDSPLPKRDSRYPERRTGISRNT